MPPIYSFFSKNINFTVLTSFLYNAVHSWSSTWQIGISYSKCNLIVIGNLANCPKYTLSSHEILNTETVKDLGVYVDHKLNFKTHIEDCIVRAKQRSALIFRGFLSRNIHHLTLAFISYIRPFSNMPLQSGHY